MHNMDHYLILRSCLIAACISSSFVWAGRRLSRKKYLLRVSAATSTLVENARP